MGIFLMLWNKILFSNLPTVFTDRLSQALKFFLTLEFLRNISQVLGSGESLRML